MVSYLDTGTWASNLEHDKGPAEAGYRWPSTMQRPEIFSFDNVVVDHVPLLHIHFSPAFRSPEMSRSRSAWFLRGHLSRNRSKEYPGLSRKISTA